MDTRGSAFKHGESREDIQHALAFPLGALDIKGLRMYFGPTRDGRRLLEVGVNDDGEAVHAMTARTPLLKLSRREKS